MKIVLGSDHAGFELKQRIVAFLTERDIQTIDVGTEDGVASVDYPDFAQRVANRVVQDSMDGILVCGTGIGMSIAANKIPGVRAALVHDAFTAQMAREHNNANILVLGGRVLDADKALDMVGAWLDGTFEERHQRRLNKIVVIEGSLPHKE
jgi:ribose 5-phosphate isomerase B